MINFYEPIISKNDIEMVQKTIKSKMISGNNPIVIEFEKLLTKFLGVKYVAVCSSGTAALHLALLANNIGKNDEVIMPSFSYIATANAVKYTGAKAVFVDVDKNTWQIDHNLIESKISNKTKAILPVHLYGGVPDLKNLNKIAKKYNLKIIHDAAESLGAEYLGIKTGSQGNASIFSFFPNKIITTGEGGMVSTNNKIIYEKVIKLRSQGLKGNIEYVHDEIGFNYRMTAISAALGISQLSAISKKLIIREEQHQYYKEELNNFVEFQNNLPEVKSSYWLTVVKLSSSKSRNNLKTYLKEKGIETRNSFFPLHLQPVEKNTTNYNLPITEDLSKKTLCLPSSPILRKSDLDYIIKNIKYFINKK